MSEAEEISSKPRRKKKITIVAFLLIILLLLSFGVYYFYKNIYKPANTDYIVRIEAQNEAVIGEVPFNKYDYIEVKDVNQETVDRIELTEETDELTLSDPTDYDNLIFDEWQLTEGSENRSISILNLFDINKDVKVYEATPVYEEANDYVLTFRADENAQIISNDNEVNYLREPYKLNQSINEILPNVEVEEGYSGKWTVNNTVIDNETEITEDSEVIYQSYQDLNNNDIDDFTETFTVQFETNAEQNIDPIENIGWENTIDLPVVQDDNLVFFDWYTEPELENKFTSETKVQNDLTLYADVRNLNEVVNTSVETPITRKDIAVQVEKLLKDRNEEVDKAYQNLLEKEEQEREEVRRYNEENNVIEQQLPTTYQLNNTDRNKLHLINFLDPSNNFLFSFVAPYGQTIKITDEVGRLVKEYAVRQQTHIVLDENEIISNGSELDKYHTEYKQINDMVFIKVQPITK